MASVVAAVANPVLGRLELGGRVNARLIPLSKKSARSSPGGVVPDAGLYIGMRGAARPARLEVSLRRDVYLPGLLYFSLVIAAAHCHRRRVWALGVGMPLLLLVAVASTSLLVMQVVARQLPHVYQPPTPVRALIEFAFLRFLSPPGSRVIAPLMLALLILALTPGASGLIAKTKQRSPTKHVCSRRKPRIRPPPSRRPPTAPRPS